MRVPGAFARLPACRHGNRTWTQRESCGDDRGGDGDQRQGIAGKAGAAGGQCVATDIRGYRPRPGRPQRTVVPLFVPVCGRQDLSVELAHISNGRYVKVRFGCPTSRWARPAEPVERMLRGRPRRAPTAPSPRSAMLYSAVLMRRLYLITRDLHLYLDRKSTRLNSSHLVISYAVFCLKKKIITLTSSNICALADGRTLPALRRHAH